MNENLKKLEKWYDSISGFEELKFPEVKTLLNVMNAVTYVNVKKEIREKNYNCDITCYLCIY